MRIRDWSSDVCSSDLDARKQTNHLTQPRKSFLRLKLVNGPAITYYRQRSMFFGVYAKASRTGSPTHRKSRTTGSPRSEERRVGKECGSTCRSRCATYH